MTTSPPASEFDTLDELRADIAEKLAEQAESRIEQEFRVAAVDAPNATVDLPDEIAKARGQERWSASSASSPARA